MSYNAPFPMESASSSITPTNGYSPAEKMLLSNDGGDKKTTLAFFPDNLNSPNSLLFSSSLTSPAKASSYDASMTPDSAISSSRRSTELEPKEISRLNAGVPAAAVIGTRRKSLKPTKSPRLDSFGEKFSPGVVFKFASSTDVSVVKGLLDYNLLLSKYRLPPAVSETTRSANQVNHSGPGNISSVSSNNNNKRRSSVPVIPRLREKRSRTGSFSLNNSNNNRAGGGEQDPLALIIADDSASSKALSKVRGIVDDEIYGSNDKDNCSNKEQLSDGNDYDYEKDVFSDDLDDGDSRSYSSSLSNNPTSTSTSRESFMKTNLELMTVSRRISAHRSVDGKQCIACNANKTPYWRDAWSELVMLCNACGLRFQKFKMHCCKCNYVPRKEDYKTPECPQCEGAWI